MWWSSSGSVLPWDQWSALKKCYFPSRTSDIFLDPFHSRHRFASALVQGRSRKESVIADHWWIKSTWHDSWPLNRTDEHSCFSLVGRGPSLNEGLLWMVQNYVAIAVGGPCTLSRPRLICYFSPYFPFSNLTHSMFRSRTFFIQC